MQGSDAAKTGRCRVRHTSGETLCATLDEARNAQREKPGAKIFRDRQR